MTSSKNLTWHQAAVNRQQRAEMNGHKSVLLWFTGLSGSGKSTIAQNLDARLFASGRHSYVLDGDNIRHGLNADLGFTAVDRSENIRRIGEVAKLFVDAGFIVTTAFISPFRHDREQVKKSFAAGDFLEIHIKCSLDECRARDPKGLYSRAEKGKISNFTGISSAYEAPENPDLIVDTGRLSVDQGTDAIIKLLRDREII